MWFSSKQISRRGDSHVLKPAKSGGVDRTIAGLNIEHFRKLLTEEKDDARRRVLLHLLAEEEAKLATLDKLPQPPDKEL